MSNYVLCIFFGKELEKDQEGLVAKFSIDKTNKFFIPGNNRRLRYL